MLNAHQSSGVLERLARAQLGWDAGCWAVRDQRRIVGFLHCCQPTHTHMHCPSFLFLPPVSDYVEMFRVHGDIHSFLYTGSPAMHSHVLALVVQVGGPAAALPASELACHGCLFYLCLLRLA